MTRTPSCLRLAVAIGAAVAFAACSRDATAPDRQEDVALAADRLERAADSIAATQGELSALPFRDAAAELRTAGRATPIRLVVDGQAQQWFAIASEQRLTISCPAVAAGEPNPGIPCGAEPLAFRTLVAWHGSDPRKLLLLTTPGLPEGGIGVADPRFPASAMPGALQYIEARDKMWFGSSGRFTSAVAPGDPCPIPSAVAARPTMTGSCRLGTFTWSLRDVVVTPFATRFVALNSATGTHTLALEPSKIAGTIHEIVLTPGPMRPPEPSPISGTLGVSVGDPVKFSFTIKNESSAPLDLSFPTDQQFDIAVSDLSGRMLWKLSEGRTYALGVHHRVLGTQESVTYTAGWTPTAHGELLASAILTSSNKRVAVRVPFTVP